MCTEQSDTSDSSETIATSECICSESRNLHSDSRTRRQTNVLKHNTYNNHTNIFSLQFTYIFTYNCREIVRIKRIVDLTDANVEEIVS